MIKCSTLLFCVKLSETRQNPILLQEKVQQVLSCPMLTLNLGFRCQEIDGKCRVMK